MTYLFDTNVYVSLLQDSAELARRRSLLARILPRTWLSSVVLHELLAGARGDIARATIRRAFGTLERVGRTLAPTHEDWGKAATIRGRIWEQYPRLRSKSFQNDLLISCTARRLGAFVVTYNRGDFETIRRYVPVVFGSLDHLAASLA